MRKLLESAVSKITVILLISALTIVGLAVSPVVIDYFQTLETNDTITISGNGCQPKVVPSLSPNQVRVKCFPPSE